MQHLLMSLESGEVGSFQDIRDATSARLEITFLDADAAAYVLIKAKLINSSVSTEKPFGWMDMSSLGVPCEYRCVVAYMQHHSCLRLWRICVFFCGCLSAYFVCEDRTLISFFKSGNASDNSLELSAYMRFFYAYQPPSKRSRASTDDQRAREPRPSYSELVRLQSISLINYLSSSVSFFYQLLWVLPNTVETMITLMSFIRSSMSAICNNSSSYHVRPILAIAKNSTWRERVSINYTMFPSPTNYKICRCSRTTSFSASGFPWSFTFFKLQFPRRRWNAPTRHHRGPGLILLTITTDIHLT